MALYVGGDRPSALPSAEVEGERPRRWWETRYGQWRLGIEVAAMRRFPGFRLGPDLNDLCWVGWIRSGLTRRRYRVRIKYLSRFPEEAPMVTIEGHRFPPDTPHLLDERRPCLYMPAQGARNGYDPGRTTAATLVAWTALWVHAYETWRDTGEWPGREA